MQYQISIKVERTDNSLELEGYTWYVDDLADVMEVFSVLSDKADSLVGDLDAKERAE